MPEHPITPPHKLVEKWYKEWLNCRYIGLEGYIATQAARWGADTELEACCELLKQKGVPAWSLLRLNRRPKPPSLKEQALETLRQIPIDPEAGVSSVELDTIRRALEQLND